MIWEVGVHFHGVNTFTSYLLVPPSCTAARLERKCFCKNLNCFTVFILKINFKRKNVFDIFSCNY